MSRRSRFVYGTSTWVTDLPARFWSPTDNTVGGTRVSAAGVPATYVVRRDGLLELPLRLHESEWPDLLALVAYGQSGLPISWAPDADNPGAAVDVYLESPAPGEKWTPTRSAEFPRVLEQTLTLRGLTTAPWAAFFE
jgi:hypothetical protein